METINRIRPFYIFTFFLSFYILTFNVGGFLGTFYSIDGKVEYDQMRDIVKGDYSLLIHPRKHLGLSLVEIPLYIAGEGLSRVFHSQLNPFITLLTNCFVAALSCLLMFLIVNLLSTQKTALIMTFLYGLCTLIWPYSKSDVADPLLGLCVMSVFWALLNFNRSNKVAWFYLSLLFMAATYVTKLVSHGFLFAWLFYIFASDFKSKTPLKMIIFKILPCILVWMAFIPLSLSINKAHSDSYTWGWLHDFGYKILIKGFSAPDGLFWYCPLLFFALFSARKFLKKALLESICIGLIIIPYYLILLFGVDMICIYDFAGRYDVVMIPLLFLFLIPFIESFSIHSLPVRFLFFFTAFFGFYVQFIGSSVSILYYANILGVSLGQDWHRYAFSFDCSPFAVYPFLIFQAVTGLASPLPRLNNVSGSIDGIFKLDYFFITHSSSLISITAVFLIILLVLSFIHLILNGSLVSSFKRYVFEISLVSFIFITILSIAFVPKELFSKNGRKPIFIANNGFEAISKSNTNIIPHWDLQDFSSQNGKPSVLLNSNTLVFLEGKSSLAMTINQKSVTISLTSEPFDVMSMKTILANYSAKCESSIPITIRIAFSKETGYPFYYAPTTTVNVLENGWKGVSCNTIVPRGSQKATLMINIWAGGLTKGSKVLIDNILISGQQ